ncbi:MAG: hypothetical protein ACYCPQ_06590 [Elusimicrobiota bacterium]
MESSVIRRFLRETSVICSPRRVLATFGSTAIDYYLVSPIEDMKDRTRVRQGRVLSEKPKILTAESLSERFSGFGEHAKDFSDWISGNYGEFLRALEYNFKNQDMSARVVSDHPSAVAGRIRGEIEDAGNKALISCPDAAWSFALMKFSIDESARSFPVHVRDLDRRGLFNPSAALESRRRQEIEALFLDAARDRSFLDTLGRKLREYGLFDEYEAKFLSFF